MWLSLPHLVYNFVRSLTGTGTHQGPKGPFGLMWLYLPHLVLSVSNSETVLTELYNSSTPTRSPTLSLKSHVWSSSSGNNCHAVHRSLSSGASVYECIMGFALSHFISQIHPRDLFRLLAIGMCHFLPVHHFVMACLLGQNTTLALISPLGHIFWRPHASSRNNQKHKLTVTSTFISSNGKHDFRYILRTYLPRTSNNTCCYLNSFITPFLLFTSFLSHEACSTNANSIYLAAIKTIAKHWL